MLTASPRAAAVTVTAATAAFSAVLAITAPVPPALVRVPEIGVEAAALCASEALIMTGTAMPDVTPEWMDFVSHNFIEPTVGDGYLDTPVVTPEQFWPFTGLSSITLKKSIEIGSGLLDEQVQALIAANRALGSPDDPITVFGYSQSAWLAAIEKQSLAEDKARDPDVPPTSFVLLADPIRPNGGLFARLGLTRWATVISAPTGTTFQTYDIARQYDFFADFPEYPLNLLADVNAIFGLLDHDYAPVTINPADPDYDPNTVVQHYGDTTYYLIPSPLPILDPLRWIGLNRLADAIDPVLRVFVELGYDRTAPFGQYTSFKLFHQIDLAKLMSDLKSAFAQSWSILHSGAAQGDSLPSRAAVRVGTAAAPAATAKSPASDAGARRVRGLGPDATDPSDPSRRTRDSTRSPGDGQARRTTTRKADHQEVPEAHMVTYAGGWTRVRGDGRFSPAGPT